MSTLDFGQVQTAGYPVRLDGRLDVDLSRWMWLVKWLLAIPHLVVLALLWAAVPVVMVIAVVAVLVTGRYPRPLFGFAVGGLRWSWRVTFYAFALGTDRYPPFSLRPDPTYPADLAVDYPQRLSRLLVLVKWWLLALPHYLIIGLVTGSIGWWAWPQYGPDQARSLPGISLVGLLVLVTAVILLVTGLYPGPLFDLIVGVHRWMFRVWAYAALLRDEYPPFRLDLGGTDPGWTVAEPRPAPGAPTRAAR